MLPPYFLRNFSNAFQNMFKVNFKKVNVEMLQNRGLWKSTRRFFEASWGVLGGVLSHFGMSCRRLGAVLGLSSGVLGPSWGALATVLATHGDPGNFLGWFWGIGKNIRPTHRRSPFLNATRFPSQDTQRSNPHPRPPRVLTLGPPPPQTLSHAFPQHYAACSLTLTWRKRDVPSTKQHM